MRFPKALQSNGTIGFVAPSFGAATEPYISTYNAAINKFKQLGHGIVEGPNTRRGDGIGISATPQECAMEFMDMYERGDSDVLISCGGGELMCTDLSYMNFDRIKQANPKWFMGYSDNTNMTYLLTTICDTASIYGPCASTFGQSEWHPLVKSAFSLLKSSDSFSVSGSKLWEKESLKSEENPYVGYNLTENTKLYLSKGAESVNELTMSGRLIGGCMDCLTTLLGTRFDNTAQFLERYKNDGFIWFIESCDLNVFSIRRALWQMKEAGWFKYVKGFLIGRPMHFAEGFMGLDQYKAVHDSLDDFNVPIVMDTDIGHLPPQMPIVCGSMADVHVKGNDINITMYYK